MKHFVLTAVLAAASALCNAQTAQDAAPAFPGAEGFGRYVTGGRGGAVYHVTNLNDSGEGSLRWALGQSGARTIVFDVAGYIDLKSQLNISNGSVTIAGQTAPEPGITVRYYTVQNKASNVIIRFIRFRRSQVKDVNDGADATWGRQCKNIIFDHCSFSWSCDEVASYYDNANFTMQWCTIAEGLNNAGHGKGAHGYGGIWGGKGASFHHNMLAHNNNRSPRINSARYNWTGYDKTVFKNSVDAERVDFRCCVNYNWGDGNGAYGNMGGYLNIVNNYYKAGPGTKNTTRVFQCSVNASKDSDGALPDGLSGRYYINGNYVTAAGSAAENYDWKGVIFDSGTGNFSKNGEHYYLDTKHLYGLESDTVPTKLTEPIPAGVVTTHSAETAFEKVIAYVGASLYRDAVDARYVEEARTGTATYSGTVTKRAGIIDVIQDPDAERNEALAEFPELASTSRPEGFDTDGDGMPDEWESAHGLNPADAEDGKLYTLDTKMGWYTNLEVYMNSLVDDIMMAGNADAEASVNEYYPLHADKWNGEVPTAPKSESYYVYVPKTESATKKINASQIVRFEYFDLDGKRLVEPQEGISVRKMYMQDGSVVADKVIKK